MKVLDRKTLDKIAGIICGDILKSKYCEEDDNNCPFYRKGTELSVFFQNAGFDEIHDGTGRKAWTLERLNEYHEDPSKIEKILVRLASPLEYHDKETTEIVIDELNNILFAEGYEMKLNGPKPYINSTILNEDTIGENNKSKKSAQNTAKVFISYSMKDKEIASKIKKILSSFGIDCFMAHDDIEVSEEWRIRILKELDEADIFIPILSNNFKDSDWCSQEAGIACFRNILFIPLSVEKNIQPYGFMNIRQGTKITRDNIPPQYLINPIIDNFPKIDILSNLINEVQNIKCFIDADEALGNLEPYFNKLTDDQVTEVVENSIKNNQIYECFRCQKHHLPNFIRINKGRIQDDKIIKLSKLIGL